MFIFIPLQLSHVPRFHLKIMTLRQKVIVNIRLSVIKLITRIHNIDRTLAFKTVFTLRGNVRYI